MPTTRTYALASAPQLHEAVQYHLTRGFVVQYATADWVQLVKAKKFQPAVAIIGTFLCGIPLLIYLVIYLLQKDEVVVLHLHGAVPLPGLPQPGAGPRPGAGPPPPGSGRPSTPAAPIRRPPPSGPPLPGPPGSGSGGGPSTPPRRPEVDT